MTNDSFYVYLLLPLFWMVLGQVRVGEYETACLLVLGLGGSRSVCWICSVATGRPIYSLY